MLLARGVAEVAAYCGTSLDDFGRCCIGLREHSPLAASTWNWVVDYYMECRRERSVGDVLRPSANDGQIEFLSVVFGIGRELVGHVGFDRLVRLIHRLDLDPTVFLEARTTDTVECELTNWREVLGIGEDATLEQAQIAFKRLAARYHPDFVQNAAIEQREHASRKMKELNTAYEVAKGRLKAAEVGTPDRQSKSAATSQGQATGSKPHNDRQEVAPAESVESGPIVQPTAAKTEPMDWPIPGSTSATADEEAPIAANVLEDDGQRAAQLEPAEPESNERLTPVAPVNEQPWGNRVAFAAVVLTVLAGLAVTLISWRVKGPKGNGPQDAGASQGNAVEKLNPSEQSNSHGELSSAGKKGDKGQKLLGPAAIRARRVKSPPQLDDHLKGWTAVVEEVQEGCVFTARVQRGKLLPLGETYSVLVFRRGIPLQEYLGDAIEFVQSDNAITALGDGFQVAVGDVVFITDEPQQPRPGASSARRVEQKDSGAAKEWENYRNALGSVTAVATRYGEQYFEAEFLQTTSTFNGGKASVFRRSRESNAQPQFLGFAAIINARGQVLVGRCDGFAPEKGDLVVVESPK